MPKVSVLLTCYNHVRYLPAAYASILAQTHRDWEIIAIDDGSTDGTREWLAENAKEAHLEFNKTNLGTYGTLNRALALSTGDVVAVFNDDDLWEPTKLERQLEILDAYPKVGLVHTDGTFIGGEGERLPGNPLGFAFPRTRSGDVLLDLIYHNKIIASAALVRRECFARCGVFNPAYFGSGDWEMWLRIAERYEVGYVDEPLTHYRVHGTNASHKLERIWRDDQMLREWIRSREAFYRRRGCDAGRLRAAMAHNEACLGTVRMLNGDSDGARESYLRSLRFNPMRFKTWLRLAATGLPRSAFRKLL